MRFVGFITRSFSPGPALLFSPVRFVSPTATGHSSAKRSKSATSTSVWNRNEYLVIRKVYEDWNIFSKVLIVDILIGSSSLSEKVESWWFSERNDLPPTWIKSINSWRLVTFQAFNITFSFTYMQARFVCTLPCDICSCWHVSCFVNYLAEERYFVNGQ